MENRGLLSNHRPVREDPLKTLNAFCPFHGWFSGSVSRYLGRVFPTRDIDRGTRTEQEEKLHSWLYSVAEADKDLVFEYVRSTERGLTFTEADKRLKENGPNIALPYAYQRWWHLLWKACFHPFNIILVVLSTLSYIAGDAPNGCIMFVLVLISISLRFHQEYTSSKAAIKLTDLIGCSVKVQRCAGRIIQRDLIVQIDQRDVVPGDIVILEPGDLFPADVRLLSTKHLVVSQSSLTGETWTTEKAADIKEDESTPLLELKSICFMGTNVVSGSGTGLVVSTGTNTYMSTMFSAIGSNKPSDDDFSDSIRGLSYVLVGAMVAVVSVILLVDYFNSNDLSESILFGLSVACALTPNMLPLIVNTSLAKGAVSMAKDRCIVKSLAAIREMGSMDILCMDKTGTLTMNHAILTHHLDAWGSQVEKVLHFAFLNSYFKADQKYPLDDAILAFVYTNGYRFRPSQWRKVDEIPFDFIRRRVSIVLEEFGSDGASYSRYVTTKGALEDVIKICSFVDNICHKRKVTAFSSEDYARIMSMGDELNNQGLRIIGVAIKRLDMGDLSLSNVESDMIFLGVITFFDPPKDSAKQALCRLSEKGVQAKVLTGDSLSLTIRICQELGISTHQVTTGPELDQLTHDAFHNLVRAATVLARLTPTQKLRVVQSLQTAAGDHHVVGFLGDGINDSLAIDAANVGISVDSGAPVSKDIADIILLEKDLNVLVAGVDHGRRTFGSTMKYVKMSVVANVGSVLSLLVATLLLKFEPLTPKQLLAQTFLYSVGQIAIPWDNVEEEDLRNPQRWSENDFPRFVIWNGPVCSLVDVGNLLCLSHWYDKDVKFVHSGWFVEGLLMQVLIFHLIRTEQVPFIQSIASWPVVCSTIVISAIGVAIPSTLIGKVLGFVSLPVAYHGFLVLLFVAYFAVGQMVKRVYVLVYKKWL